MKNTQLLLAGIIIVLFSCGKNSNEPSKKDSAKENIQKFLSKMEIEGVVFDSVQVLKIDSATNFDIANAKLSQIEPEYMNAISELESSIAEVNKWKSLGLKNNEIGVFLELMKEKKQAVIELQPKYEKASQEVQNADTTKVLYQSADVLIFGTENGIPRKENRIIFLDKKNNVIPLNYL